MGFDKMKLDDDSIAKLTEGNKNSFSEVLTQQSIIIPTTNR